MLVSGVMVAVVAALLFRVIVSLPRRGRWLGRIEAASDARLSCLPSMLRCARGGGTAPARGLGDWRLRLREWDDDIRVPVRRLIFRRNDSSFRIGMTNDGGDWDSGHSEPGVLGR